MQDPFLRLMHRFPFTGFYVIPTCQMEQAVHDVAGDFSLKALPVLFCLSLSRIKGDEDFTMVKRDHIRGSRIVQKVRMHLGYGIIRHQRDFHELQLSKGSIGRHYCVQHMRKRSQSLCLPAIKMHRMVLLVVVDFQQRQGHVREMPYLVTGGLAKRKNKRRIKPSSNKVSSTAAINRPRESRWGGFTAFAFRMK